jgi:hypothetical protein
MSEAEREAEWRRRFSTKPPTFNAQGELQCPDCEHKYVHVDEVDVAARPKQDGEFNNIRVDANGKISTHRDESAASGSRVDAGRRHRIALNAWCEGCGARFSIVFTQHKGQTIVETVSTSA